MPSFTLEYRALVENDTNRLIDVNLIKFVPIAKQILALGKNEIIIVDPCNPKIDFTRRTIKQLIKYKSILQQFRDIDLTKNQRSRSIPGNYYSHFIDGYSAFLWNDIPPWIISQSFDLDKSVTIKFAGIHETSRIEQMENNHALITMAEGSLLILPHCFCPSILPPERALNQLTIGNYVIDKFYSAILSEEIWRVVDSKTNQTTCESYNQIKDRFVKNRLSFFDSQ